MSNLHQSEKEGTSKKQRKEVSWLSKSQPCCTAKLCGHWLDEGQDLFELEAEKRGQINDQKKRWEEEHVKGKKDQKRQTLGQ